MSSPPIFFFLASWLAISPWLVDRIPIPLPPATGLISCRPIYHLLLGLEYILTTGTSSTILPVTWSWIVNVFVAHSPVTSKPSMNLNFLSNSKTWCLNFEYCTHSTSFFLAIYAFFSLINRSCIGAFTILIVTNQK